MKKTVLNHIHKQLGAKMVDFGGYEMPLQYSSIKEEHLSVRNNVGVFDVSHMGEIEVTGSEATHFLQYVCSNDIEKIKIGQAQYNYFPTEKGTVVDDLIVYKTEKEKYLLIVNALNIEKNWRWLNKQNTFQTNLINKSEKYALLAVQGPNSLIVMQQLTTDNLSQIPFYHHKTILIKSKIPVLITTTGYTGAGGFEILIENKYAEQVWGEIFKVGSKLSILPVGLAARDTLRLEMGYCLYGNELSETTSSLESGLGWVTKFNKVAIGFDVLMKQKKTGIQKKLVALKLLEKGIPRKGYKIFNKNDELIGEVTSGCYSPVLNEGIALGYVTWAHRNIGTCIKIEIRNKLVKSEIIKLPFIKK